MNNLDLFVYIQAVYSVLTIYNICNFGDIYIPTREFRVFYITMKFMHKLAYAEFSQDGGRLLKFVKHFRKLSEQLNAMDKQKYEI
jgi:hypothetical protein